MFDNLLWHLLAVVQTISLAVSSFYHEPSYRVLRPSDDTNRLTDFGFSMDYQIGPRPKLIVGSPHGDQVGRVYSCPMNPDMVTTCENLNIDVKKLASDYDKNDTNQNFCHGGAIATTPNYFMTCAPLWTTTGVKSREDGESFTGSYGTCFVYNNNGSVHRFQGILEQFKQKTGEKYAGVYGGVGWSLLADPVNEIILVAKPFKQSDIQYVSSSHLEEHEDRKSQSLFYSREGQKIKDYFRKYTLVGNAMAAGKFIISGDKSYKPTMYAFSAKGTNDIGHIHFLIFEKEKPSIYKIDGTVLMLSSKVSGNMYGASLSAADLDVDGISDLLVGAPAQTNTHRVEAGAVYIYTGKNMSVNLIEPIITILGEKPLSRFGSAIVTTDLDGDAKPEIFVSAPYEDEGKGALYIISGNELFGHMGNKRRLTTLLLSKLLSTQRIQRTEFESFGFSLQIVSDVNDNGCNEIAVGTPRNASVLLLRCIPVINATLSVQREKTDVKSADTQYDVKVCVKVSYPVKPKKISTVLQVVGKIRGPGATILKGKFDVNLAERRGEYCEDVTVSLQTKEIGSYNFSATLEYKDETAFNKTEFDPTWVRLSGFSKMSAWDSVDRACPANTECTPKLRMDILWNGREPPENFTVNEKTKLNVTFKIYNDGYDAYDTCVRFDVIGVTERVPCKKDDSGRYLCSPYVKPLAKDVPYPLNFEVTVERARNESDMVHIVADLYDYCSFNTSKRFEKTVQLIYKVKDIYITESSHTVTVTDTQIADTTLPTLIDTQKYEIVNNGSLVWENVIAIIWIRKMDYIQNYIISDKRCNETSNTETYVEFICSGLTLESQQPTNRLPINVRLEVLHAKIMENLVADKLVLESNIQVMMASYSRSLNQTTTILFDKTKSFASNLPAIILIAIIFALIIIAGVILILSKIGFFHRKEKERLDSLKESIRRKSQSSSAVRPSVAGGEPKPESEEHSMEDDFDIEVLEDCAFEPVPTTTEDNAALIVREQNEPSRKRSVNQDVKRESS